MTAPAAQGAAPACWQARVEGRVQGVGYREACVAQAQALGVRGWVRNRLDGSVEVLMQADEATLARMAAWLRQGPTAARVEAVRVEPLAPPWETCRRFERRPSA